MPSARESYNYNLLLAASTSILMNNSLKIMIQFISEIANTTLAQGCEAINFIEQLNILIKKIGVINAQEPANIEELERRCLSHISIINNVYLVFHSLYIEVQKKGQDVYTQDFIDYTSRARTSIEKNSAPPLKPKSTLEYKELFDRTATRIERARQAAEIGLPVMSEKEELVDSQSSHHGDKATVALRVSRV